jgi:hypothetical protein
VKAVKGLAFIWARTYPDLTVPYVVCPLEGNRMILLELTPPFLLHLRLPKAFGKPFPAPPRSILRRILGLDPERRTILRIYSEVEMRYLRGEEKAQMIGPAAI